METTSETDTKTKPHIVRRQTIALICMVASFVAGEFGIVVLDWIVERNKAPIEQTVVQSIQAAPELSSDASARQTRSAN